jgi:hypothetical protein
MNLKPFWKLKQRHRGGDFDPAISHERTNRYQMRMRFAGTALDNDLFFGRRL